MSRTGLEAVLRETTEAAIANSLLFGVYGPNGSMANRFGCPHCLVEADPRERLP